MKIIIEKIKLGLKLQSALYFILSNGREPTIHIQLSL